MLFSHVQKSCFRAKAHLVSHWCLYNRTTFSSYLTSVFWWTSVILSFRPICQIYVKCVNNVICNREFFQKTLVTKVSWPKLLVTLKMMDVRQNISVIQHVQLSFRIRVLQTQLKNKCRNFENKKKKNFLYCLNKLLLYYISTVKAINRQNGSGSTDLLLLRALGLLAFSPVIIHSFFYSYLQSFYKVRDCSNIHNHEGTNARLMVRLLIRKLSPRPNVELFMTRTKL